jgi:hypothetical protein
METIPTGSFRGHAAITGILYNGSRHFILGSRVPGGCGRWSTVSIRCCSGLFRKLDLRTLAWPA